MSVADKARREHEDGPAEPPLRCSFCDRTEHEVSKLIAAPNVSICDECVEICNDILAGDAWRERAGGMDMDGGPRRERGSPDTTWCTLCRRPCAAEGTLTLEGKGILCRSCVAAVRAAVDARP